MAFPILERPDAPEAFVPRCQMLNTVELGHTAALNPGATRDSNFIELTGYRRYRLKVVQLTGGTSTDVRILDLPFGRTVANAFENVLLGTPLVGVRTVFNFGEGTAIFQNFMGTWLIVQLKNNDGAAAATYELELWAQ